MLRCCNVCRAFSIILYRVVYKHGIEPRKIALASNALVVVRNLIKEGQKYLFRSLYTKERRPSSDGRFFFPLSAEPRLRAQLLAHQARIGFAYPTQRSTSSLVRRRVRVSSPQANTLVPTTIKVVFFLSHRGFDFNPDIRQEESAFALAKLADCAYRHRRYLAMRGDIITPS